MKNYYHILDVPRSASSPEIQKAFRQLARQYHPDASGTLQTAGKFRELRESYEILADDQQREIYDEALQEYETVLRERPRSFPSAAGRKNSSTGSIPRPDKNRIHPAVAVDSLEGFDPENDLQTVLEIDLEDTLHPANYTVKVYQDLIRPEADHFQVALPGKLSFGAHLQVADLGMRRPGRRPGNLWIRVQFRPHPFLSIQGATVYHPITLHSWEAALGSSLEVSTLDGLETVVLSPYLFTRPTLRLPGRGLYRKNGTRGDYCISIKVGSDFPQSPRARYLWQELEKEHLQSRFLG